jgi:hypothetical protein
MAAYGDRIVAGGNLFLPILFSLLIDKVQHCPFCLLFFNFGPYFFNFFNFFISFLFLL